jgi:glutamate-5-semialdehyde dehydrogenase
MNAIAPDLSADARAAARAMASVDAASRNAALEAIARAIEARATEIEAANTLDVNAATGHQSAAIIDRLTLTPDRIAGLAEGVRAVIALPDPIGTVLSRVERDNGLVIEKVRVPLGVVAIIYEARPNVTTDAAALTIKSGNACILRGSRMAANTNRVLIDLVRSAIEAGGLPIDAVQEMETDRERLREFITRPGAADVVIPRGGEELKHFLLDNSRIPVLAAAGGNNHVYVDASADAAMAEAIAVNAKIQRPGVCNSAETLLVHRDRPELMAAITAALRDQGVEIVEGEEAWDTEFLDMKMAVRTVDSLDAAIDHIATYGTGHSEAIVTADPAAADRFVTEVDAAAVYVNASTRFTDGAEYGMGAEMGISTSRLHARGPVALNELTTTKYVVRGDGQVRA